ncbi:hypothetical protein EG329_001378 [Mollisiaceae sp. DMI_Dod_QoI]|nr:hypothetical protein EG329_001378 [Helotiales sp. DMI_Dod_QoI]
MVYESQYNAFVEKASQEGFDLVYVDRCLNERLDILDRACSKASHDERLYHTESLTWNFLWPRVSFPGTDPAPTSSSTRECAALHPSYISFLESLKKGPFPTQAGKRKRLRGSKASATLKSVQQKAGKLKIKQDPEIKQEETGGFVIKLEDKPSITDESEQGTMVKQETFEPGLDIPRLEGLAAIRPNQDVKMEDELPRTALIYLRNTMEYVSQFPIMRDKAVAAGVPFEDVQNYYRGRLTDYSTPSFHATPLERQYNAEWITWVAFWPEERFPGLNPSSLNTPLADTLNTETNKVNFQPSGNAASTKGFPQSSASRKISYQKEHSKDSRAEKQIPFSKGPYTYREQNLHPDERICGGCGIEGHPLADCTKNVDEYGFINGCPKCNTTKHLIDNCRSKNRLTDGRMFYFLVVKRLGKPPLRSREDFRFVSPKKFAELKKYPQTCQFAAQRRNHGISQMVTEIVLDPSWKSPHLVASQVHPLDANREPSLLVKSESTTPFSSILHTQRPVNRARDWLKANRPLFPACSPNENQSSFPASGMAQTYNSENLPVKKEPLNADSSPFNTQIDSTTFKVECTQYIKQETSETLSFESDAKHHATNSSSPALPYFPRPSGLKIEDLADQNPQLSLSKSDMNPPLSMCASSSKTYDNSLPKRCTLCRGFGHERQDCK